MSTVAAEATPPGVTLPSRPEGRSGFLADVIVELDLAGREEVDRATKDSRMRGATLATVLVESGTLTERELARAVAERHGLAMVDLDTFPVDPEAAALVGRATAKRYGVAPAGFAPDGSLLLAMADPGDSLARNDVAVMTRLEVTPVIASRAQIDAVLEDLPETALRPTPDPEAAPAPAPVAGALLWQSEDSAAEDLERRASGMSAVQTADLAAEHKVNAQRLGAELAEQKGRNAELELALRAMGAELEGLNGRHERELASRDGRLEELEAELAAARRGET